MGEQAPIIIQMWTDGTVISAKRGGQDGDEIDPPQEIPCPDIVCAPAAPTAQQSAAMGGSDCVYVKIGNKWYCFC